MVMMAEVVAVALAAGTLSGLVTTPLWLRARHQAVSLRSQAAVAAADLLAARCRSEAGAVHSTAVAAETRYLVDVRVPATLNRLANPRLTVPVPGLLHPQFAGTALEADHLALLDQLTVAVTVARGVRLRPPQPGPVASVSSLSSAADWFEPRVRPSAKQSEETDRSGSSVVWSAYQSGTESGRASAGTRYERSH